MLDRILRKLGFRKGGVMTTSIVVTKSDGTVIDYGVVSKGRVTFTPEKG